MAAAVLLSVVVPAYNEEARLGATLTELQTHLQRQPWTWEVRVVDDGSLDGTGDVAARHAASDPRIVVQREPHRGKGGAVKAGLLAGVGEYRFICDADLSMPVDELSRFLPPALAGFDVAIGSREGHHARRIGEPMIRHVAGRVFNFGVQRLMLPGINDTQCGFKMFTAAAVDAIFPAVRVDGWAFDIEVLYLARMKGLRIVEVPIEWHYRRESRLNLLRDGAGMLRELLAVRGRARRGAYQATPRG